ncbi:MAG: quinone-dependent dihydroorotate dehydrogenase [Pseudobdellovibrionaceae bacterium]
MYKIIRPLLFKIDPEKAHGKTLKLLKSVFAPTYDRINETILHTEVAGLSFVTPIGMAAGFDKDAEVIEGLFGLGFGFVEVGTVTPKPQAGNPKPRIFRDVKSSSIINRMGFPNGGLAVFKHNLLQYRQKHHHAPGPVGVNIGMNKDQANPVEDYITLIEELSGLASYFTVNISSPNTPGLRDLQDPQYLKPLLAKLIEARNLQEHKRPLFVKLSPDLTDKQIDDIAPVLLDVGIDGVILTNTTLARPETLSQGFAAEKGGLSGPHVRDRSTVVIGRFFTLLRGQIPIIGVGGISSASDAYEKIAAGASLVQLYTGLVYEGPSLPTDIARDLLEMLQTYNIKNVKDAVGIAHKKGAASHAA